MSDAAHSQLPVSFLPFCDHSVRFPHCPIVVFNLFFNLTALVGESFQLRLIVLGCKFDHPFSQVVDLLHGMSDRLPFPQDLTFLRF